ncbi:MAG: protein kinase domain-containing protein, partial [Planctomycetota bacterium]
MSEAKEHNNKRLNGDRAGPTRSFDGSVRGSGSQIGPFRIERELGRGAVGVVYLAHDTKLDRSVAIKSLPAEVMANPKVRSRFSREARLLASVNHPNIATIHEVLEETEGVGYLVLEYVPGQTLAERIAKGPFKLEDALSIALQIAEAVAAAHEHDIIHRDLKPGNIKITPEGKVKVLDFGLAKAVGGEATDQQSTVTEPGRIIGTPAYMSPEQARGKPTDKRSDIWSFGCVLYEMLTATIPFKGETISDTLANILDREPNWSALPDTIPANIQLLIRRCLEKEPRRRLRDISDIAITLEETTIELQRPTLRIEAIETGRTKSKAGSRRVLPWLVTGVAVSVLVFFALIIGLKFARPSGKPEGIPVSLPTAEPIKAIVVLPFENRSGDPNQEYFVDTMTDELSAELGKISALIVKGQYSAKRYKDTDKQIPEIARELGVDAVIRCSVFKPADANKVRITAQLIHGSTEDQLWANSYEDELSDVITLQRKVALAIAKEIKVKLTPQEEKHLASARPINPQAHDAYIKGRSSFFKFTKEGFELAADYLEDAIEIDPNYAEAYARLAPAYWLPSTYGYATTKESFRKAKRAVDKAIELDDSLSMAHYADGWIALAYDWEWDKAERKFNLALELNPNDSFVYQSLALYFVVAGRLDEAVDAIQTALKLDPLSLMHNEALGSIYMLSRKFEQAEIQYKNTLELDQNYLPAIIGLAGSYQAMPRYPEAIAEIERAISLAGRTPVLVALLAKTYALSGRKGDVETLLKELKESQEKGTYVLPIYFAEVYTSLGNKDEAFRWLQKASEERSYGMLLLRHDWYWDPLRSDPRFDEVLKQMNFPKAPDSETEAKPVGTAQPIEKIAVPAKKKLHSEPLPLQISLLMSRGNSIALSSDGRYLVYVGVDSVGTQRLYLRDMENDFDPTPIRGTEGATCPFFRPDGEWIGFFAKDESMAQCALKRVRTQGGVPEFICRVAPTPCGGCWSQDNFIIYSSIYHISLIKIAAFGDAREYVARADPNNGEHGQAWPDILPEGKGVLYTVWGGDSFTDYRTMIKWSGIDKPQELLPNSSFARYVPTGHIVFLRAGSLQAVRFDIDRPGPEAIRGEPKILLEDIGVTACGSAQFAFSRDEGTLVYAHGSSPFGLLKGDLVWVDPEEPNATLIPDSRQYYSEWAQPRLSPDDNWIAITPAYETNLLLYKFGIGYSLPLTIMKGWQACAVWEPQPTDNHVVFYSIDADSPPDIYWCLLNNSDAPEPLYKDPNATEASSFSPDGKYLAFTNQYVLETSLDQTSDIWLLEIETRKTTKWTNTPQYSERGAEFSPDGKWIAYTSDQMGENEVYVQEFQLPPGRMEKVGAGSEAAWGPDEQKLELFYRDGKQLIRAKIQTEPQFKVQKEALFDDVYIQARFPGYRNYDVSKDGKRFLMIKQVDEQPA